MAEASFGERNDTLHVQTSAKEKVKKERVCVSETMTAQNLLPKPWIMIRCLQKKIKPMVTVLQS